MRNKVNMNIAKRMTAILLTLVMIAGSFSIAVFAEDAQVDNAPSAPAETVNNEPEEKPETVGETAESGQKETTPEPSEPAVTEEKAEPEGEQNDESSVPQDEQAQNTEEAVTEEGSAEEAVLVPEAVTDTAKLAGENNDGKPSGSVVTLSSYAISVMREAQFVHSGDHVIAGTVLKLSVKDGSGDHRFTINGSPIDGNSFEMPDNDVTIGVEYLFEVSGAVPDGVSLNFTVDGAPKTGPEFYAAPGAKVKVQSVAGLPSGYQQGGTPGAAKQLKLTFGDSGNAARISLNNSEATNNYVYTMPEKAVNAQVATANIIKTTSDPDTYHKGTCSVRNLSDSTSHFADIYALLGDKISVTYDTNVYESVDIKASDASGKAISVSGGQFTMPSSMADVKVTYYYKPKTVTVTNSKPDRGTISTTKDQYRPGDTVVVKVKANSGYKFNTKTLVYTYSKDGKMNVVQITKGSDGKYSFIMPFYPVDIRGVFVEKATADKAADPEVYIDYSVAEEETEETAEAVETLETLETVDIDHLNLVPLTSLITAQTVLAVSTGLNIIMAD